MSKYHGLSREQVNAEIARRKGSEALDYTGDLNLAWPLWCEAWAIADFEFEFPSTGQRDPAVMSFWICIQWLEMNDYEMSEE